MQRICLSLIISHAQSWIQWPILCACIFNIKGILRIFFTHFADFRKFIYFRLDQDLAKFMQSLGRTDIHEERMTDNVFSEGRFANFTRQSHFDVHQEWFASNFLGITLANPFRCEATYRLLCPSVRGSSVRKDRRTLRISWSFSVTMPG